MAQDEVLTFPLVPRRKVYGAGFGSHVSNRKGPGFDFFGVRDYQAGDPRRQIDHKASARRSGLLGRDAFVVREYHFEEAIRVVLVVDRSPRMQLYPQWTGYLSKPEVVAAAGRMIVASAKAIGALIGYLDFASWQEDREAFWRPPTQETQPNKINTKYLPYPRFTAPDRSVEDSLEFLFAHQSAISKDSFVFILSDFLEMPSEDLIAQACGLWDVVPVVIQDPILESSFPTWQEPWWSRLVPARIPCGSLPNAAQVVPISAREANARNDAHAARTHAIRASFEEYGVSPVWLETTEPLHILGEFTSWARSRQLS